MRSVDLTTAFLGCTVWLPLMLWITALVHWMVAGEIEIISGFVGVGVGIGLGLITLQPPVPIAQPIAYITVYATIALFPFVRAGMTRRELKAIDLQALERAYAVLGERPRDVMARFRVAQAAWIMGMPGHALRLGEACLEEMPRNVFGDEHAIVRGWRRVALPPDAFEPYTCLDCHAPVQPGRTHCARCGAPYLLERAQGKTSPKTAGRKMVAAWVAAAAALGGIPSATALPPVAALVAILMILGLAGLVIFLAFRPEGSQA